MPNGNENVVDLESFSPSWMEDGFGIPGEQSDIDQSEVRDWDTNAWTDNSQANEDFITAGGGCLSDAGDPPQSGTYVLGSVNGTCQWINTTTCS